MEQYTDRTEAGILLAEKLKKYKKAPNTIVLALPRGGVPVAYEIAKALELPLDLCIVRKLGVPGHEELAMGAIARDQTIVFNEDILSSLHMSQEEINQVIHHEQEELNRRERLYRGNQKYPELNNKTVILVDDGIATGATMRAAIKSLNQLNASHIILAVPVAALSICHEMQHLVDEIICPLKPINFYAVGLWFSDFSQTSDAEVIRLFNESKRA